MKIRYEAHKFKPASLALIEQANAIVDRYATQGLDLTLRQLYYRFVAAGTIENKQTEYDNLGTLINKARLAGLVDWSAITDRTRNLRTNAHWSDPADVINSAAEGYAIDKWSRENGQEYRVEVWVEKDALVGVVAQAAQPLDVPYFSCRGYTSQSEMWAAAVRIVNRYHNDDQQTIIIHLGDHDPSGIDMSRDIEERLYKFTTHHEATPPIFERIALNMDQVRQYNPPPNPAKITDSRAPGYIATHGRSSWELDALEPTILNALIVARVEAYRDDAAWATAVAKEDTERESLRAASRNWEDVQGFVERVEGKDGLDATFDDQD